MRLREPFERMRNIVYTCVSMGDKDQDPATQSPVWRSQPATATR
jgi:hypothetical protein